MNAMRAMRYVLCLLLVLAAWAGFGVGEARAEVPVQEGCGTFNTSGSVVSCVTREQAHAYAQALDGYTYTHGSIRQLCNPVHDATNKQYVLSRSLVPCPTGGYAGGAVVVRYQTAECPVGSEWNEQLGRCFDPAECLERNGPANGMPYIETSRPFSEKCVAGCQLRIEGGGSCTSVVGVSGSTVCSGVFQYSGNTCAADPTDPAPDDTGPPPGEDACTSAGPESGMTLCKKPNGNECVSANSGAMICWGVGETGQKAIAGDAQTRGPGPNEPTPEPPTPPESFDPTKKRGPITTTTTTTTNNNTTTTTTTVVNNTTQYGTQAPGKPGDNKGPGGSGGDGKDGDENTATGGGDCDTPPATTGDQVLGMIAKQQWETRCALEKIGEGSTVSGDIGDCNSPFTVEGDDANAQRLRAMREQICPGGDTAKHGDGDAIDWSGLDGPASADGLGLFVEEEIGADGLDVSGLGFTRSCPTMPTINVLGQSIQFDNSVMCQWLELGGQILLVLAALLSVRIMAGVTV